MKKVNKSHIFKHLHSTAICFHSYNSLSFKIIDKTNSKSDLKIKEALHINWSKPNLKAQQNHLALILSLQFLSPLFFFCLYSVFMLLFFLITFIISDINYRHLLLSKLHFAITSSRQNTTCITLSFSSVVSIIFSLIVGIFNCLNQTLLLLHLIITHLVNVFYNNYVINICPRKSL